MDYMQALAHVLPANFIRWTRADHLHITLQFIPQISPNELQDLSYSIAHTLSQIKPFTIFMNKLTIFPSRAHSRAIVLTLKATPELLKLHQLLGEKLNLEPGLDFCPHITLGRIKSENKIQLPEALLPSININISVNKISLFESQPHAQGSEYIWQRGFILLGT